MNPRTKITVEWKENRFQVEVKGDYTIGDFKYAIFKKTGVNPSLQTYTNPSLMGENVNEGCTLDELHLTNDSIVYMTSALDEEQPGTSGMTSGAHQGSRSVQQHFPLKEIHQQKVLGGTRPGKYLLVLDIDLTIYDCSMEARASAHQSARPYLQQFLKSVYEDYDIIIWSATGMGPIMRKMNTLGITNNVNYSILSYMDSSQMISVPIISSCMAEIKPLQIIWQKYGQFNSRNTLICDDQENNYYLNKHNGVPISPYSYTNYETDRELMWLARYLKYVATFHDVSVMDHTCWKACI